MRITYRRGARSIVGKVRFQDFLSFNKDFRVLTLY